MSKRIEDLIVIENKRISTDFHILELQGDMELPAIKPGQFLQVRVDGSNETFLRRPISIHDVDYKRNTIRILIQVAGSGTLKLSQLRVGDTLNIVYPLGNSFSTPEPGEKILLVGGGCGIAPLLYLGKHLKSIGYKPDILLGFRNRSRIIEFEAYSEIGTVYLTTEDGSEGEKGYVTDHSVLSEVRYDRIYCCGPDSMMRAVAGYAIRQNAVCEVSLENLMACGIGVCLCCVVDTIKGNLCSCIDGPVFNITDLKW